MTDEIKAIGDATETEDSAIDVLSSVRDELFDRYEGGDLNDSDAEAVYAKYGEINELIQQLYAKNFHDASINLENAKVIKSATQNMQTELDKLKKPGGVAASGKQLIDTAGKIIEFGKSLLGQSQVQ